MLVRVARFRVRAFYELERHARKVPWERFVAKGRPVRLRVTSRRSRLYHEGAVAQRLLEAIAHRLGQPVPAAGPAAERVDDEDGGEGEAASQLFVVRLLHDECLISADASGALLYQRGYRQALAKAPLRETLAAAMLLAVGWRGQVPLLDPFCGSGTIPIEAALIARNLAPGLAADTRPRGYAFQEWPEFDAALWARLLDRAREAARPSAAVPIVGSDRDAGAVAAAVENARRAGVLDDLELRVASLSAISPPAEPGWLVTNPPYGVRVGEREALRNLYATLGRLARTHLPRWSVALLSADRRLEGHAALAFREVLRTRNGGIPVRLVAAQPTA